LGTTLHRTWPFEPRDVRTGQEDRIEGNYGAEYTSGEWAYGVNQAMAVVSLTEAVDLVAATDQGERSAQFVLDPSEPISVAASTFSAS